MLRLICFDSKIIVVLIMIIVLSCSNQKQKTMIDQLAYYELIDFAEIDILNGNYKNSEVLYERVFDEHSYMFAIDLNNAIRCSAILNNWENVSFYAEKLMLKGVGLNYFEDNIFNGFKDTEYWNELCFKYHKINSLFKENFNQELLDGINKLVYQDQFEYCQIPTKKNYDELKSNLTPKVDNNLLDLFNLYGFPTEEKIGMNSINNKEISYIPIYRVLYIHSYQSGDLQLINESKKYVDSLSLDKRFLDNILNTSIFIQTIDNDSIYIDKNLNFDQELNLELQKLNYTIKNSKGFNLSNQGLQFFNLSDSTSKDIFYRFHKAVGVLKHD